MNASSNSSNTSTTFRVAVHPQFVITKRGFVYKQHPRWVVVGGPNPYGPRGGQQGKWVDGAKLSGLYRTIKEAEEQATRELEKRGLLPKSHH